MYNCNKIERLWTLLPDEPGEDLKKILLGYYLSPSYILCRAVNRTIERESSL
jgi:hypothetical protein